MCAVSMMIEYYQKDFPNRWPWYEPPKEIPPSRTSTTTEFIFDPPPDIEVQVQKLKDEVSELKDLLKQTKKFDEATGQPDCEMESKINFVRQLADFVGVEMRDVFPEA